jgi:hypothetical protein
MLLTVSLNFGEDDAEDFIARSSDSSFLLSSSQSSVLPGSQGTVFGSSESRSKISKMIGKFGISY